MKSLARRKTVRHAKMSLAQEQDVCKRVGMVLHNAYPGYIWKVWCQEGVLYIHNMLLSGRWGFCLKVGDLDSSMKKVVMAGGELLERYRMRRGRADRVELASVKRNIAGEAIADE